MKTTQTEFPENSLLTISFNSIDPANSGWYFSKQ